MWRNDARIAVLDIGGTSIKSALWTENALTGQQETATPVTSARALLEQVFALLDRMGPFEAVGVSTRGTVGREGEILFDNVLSDYTGTPLRAMLEERYGVPAAVENDVNAAAFGEARLGAGRGAKDFLMVTYGTCVGGAIVLGGRVYRGTSSSAGEFGGMQLFSQQPAEGPWGAFYENFAAASSLVAMVRQRRPELTDGRAVCRHLDDPEVSALVDQWVRRVAYGLSTLIHIFNPPLMVLGGGILQNEELFRRIDRCTRSQIMPGFEPLELKPALLGNAAGMAGAALLAGERLNA